MSVLPSCLDFFHSYLDSEEDDDDEEELEHEEAGLSEKKSKPHFARSQYLIWSICSRTILLTFSREMGAPNVMALETEDALDSLFDP